MIRNSLVFFLSLLIGMAPLESRANALRLIIETGLKEKDTTRLTIDFNTLTFEELGRLPEKLGPHANILSDANTPLQVHAFVPKELSQAEKDEFAANLQKQMSQRHQNFKIEVKILEVATEDPAPDLQDSGRTEGQSHMRHWRQGFRNSAAKFKHWLSTGFNKDKDERVGAVIGKTRGWVSIAVWFGTNWVSTNLASPASIAAFLTASSAQGYASYKLDKFFSINELKVDVFKATHRLPGERIPYVGFPIRSYNDTPVFKSWVIGNLIGFVCANYFRFWSWVADPVRTSAPWSLEALSTYGWLFGFGSISAAFGSQAPRMLRKKGYLDSRMQYYIYTSYGVIMQMGGFLYGLGLNRSAIVFSGIESAFKLALYGFAHFLPNKDPRALVLHPGLNEKEIEEILYREGYDQNELKKFSDADFDFYVSRLKGKKTCAAELISQPAE